MTMMLKTMPMMIMLSAPGTTLNATAAREHPRSTKLSGFLAPHGFPITAERASEVFGTRVRVDKDFSEELRKWKEEAW
jgi:hypothetical protein